jgi:hypothetical protein
LDPYFRVLVSWWGLGKAAIMGGDY